MRKDHHILENCPSLQTDRPKVTEGKTWYNHYSANLEQWYEWQSTPIIVTSQPVILFCVFNNSGYPFHSFRTTQLLISAIEVWEMGIPNCFVDYPRPFPLPLSQIIMEVRLSSPPLRRKLQESEKIKNKNKKWNTKNDSLGKKSTIDGKWQDHIYESE